MLRCVRVTALGAVLVCLSAPALAECLWDDKTDFDNRAKTFITNSTPATCRPNAYGTAQLFTTEPGKLKYEIVVRAGRLCFYRTTRALAKLQASNKLLACRGNAAKSAASFYKADGGPTFIFTFAANKAEMREASGYGKR